MPEVPRRFFGKQPTISLNAPEVLRSQTARRVCPHFMNDGSCCLNAHNNNCRLFDRASVVEIKEQGKNKVKEIPGWGTNGEVLIVINSAELAARRAALKRKLRDDPRRIFVPEGVLLRNPPYYWATVAVRSEASTNASSQVELDDTARVTLRDGPHQVTVLTPMLRTCPAISANEIPIYEDVPPGAICFPGVGIFTLRPYSNPADIPSTATTSY